MSGPAGQVRLPAGQVRIPAGQVPHPEADCAAPRQGRRDASEAQPGDLAECRAPRPTVWPRRTSETPRRTSETPRRTSAEPRALAVALGWLGGSTGGQSPVGASRIAQLTLDHTTVPTMHNAIDTIYRIVNCQACFRGFVNQCLYGFHESLLITNTSACNQS